MELPISIGIVDDEPLICTHLETMIRSAGPLYQVKGVCSGGKAALIQWKEDPPDLIITDIMMSDLDGLSLIAEARSLGWNTEFFLLSGHENFQYAQKAIQYGVRRYFLKPLKREELITALEEIQNSRMEKADPISSKQEKLDVPVCVVAVEAGFLDAQAEVEPLVYAFCQVLKNKLAKVERIWQEGRLILMTLQVPDSSEIQSRCRSMLEISRSMLQSSFPDQEIYVYAGVGHKAHNQSAIGKSRNRAVEALDQGWKSGKTGVYVWVQKNKQVSETDSVQIYRKLASELVYQILTGNADAIHAVVDAFFLRETTMDRYETRQSVYSECGMIYLLLGLMIEEEKLGDGLEPVDSLLFRLRRCSSYRQAVQTFSDSLCAISSEIKGVAPNRDNSVIFRIKKYLMKNYEKNVGLKELSETFYLSQSYLSSYFKKETGKTISDFVIMLRIQESKRFLQTTSMSVEEVSGKVGYSNSRYFSTLFKRVTGLTPVQYRLQSLSEQMGGQT